MEIKPEWVWNASCYLWVKDNKIRNEKGVPLEFDNHRYLIDLYDDYSPIQVTRKASQVGYSTLAIIKSFHAASFKNFSQIYTLPTSGDISNFVPPKVNRLIDNNPVFQRLVKDKDTIYQKQAGDSFIYYRGTFSQKTEREKMEGGVGIIITSDLNIHDECDRSDQTVLQQYESRLDASTFKGRWYFSNPSNPSTLSQKLYEQSDQKHWFVKCSHCNEWQYLDFWKNIKEGNYVCSNCEGIITDDDRRNGRWIKKYRDKDISGYWISHLICPGKSAKEIEQASLKDKGYFYNFVLGLPYRGSDVVIDQDVILKNIDTQPNLKEHNVMGIDQGIKKHWVLMNRQGVFKVGVTEDWGEIERLLNDYDVECCVIDGMPDITEPRKLRDKYLGKIWLSFFKKEIRKANFISWDKATHSVYSDRTKVIQQTIDQFHNRKIRFQMDIRDLADYIQHWKSLYKIVEKDNMGIERDIWESDGNDHFVFATIYALLALQRGVGDTEIMAWKKEIKPYDGLAPDISEIARKSGENII